MTDYSKGYYDLSITNNIVSSPLTTDEITTKTVVEYFFTTVLGKDSGLSIEDYGHTYILGFKNKPHFYDCEKTKATVNRKMVGKSTSDSMPNDLPSQKNYGFKSNQKFPIFCREIESFKVFSVPDISKIKDKLQLYTSATEYKPVIKLKPIYARSKRGKLSADQRQDKVLYGHLGFKGRQTTKSSIKQGGRSKEFSNVSNKFAYASRLYKLKSCNNPLQPSKYQFLISNSGLVAVKVSNQPNKAIGQIIMREGRQYLSPTVEIKPGDTVLKEMLDRATNYVNSVKASEVLVRVKTPDTKDLERIRKYQDKKRRRQEKAKTKKLGEVIATFR